MSSELSLVRKTLIVAGVMLAVLAAVSFLVIARYILPLIFGAILFAVVLNRMAAAGAGLLPTSLSRGLRVGIVVAVLTLVTALGIYFFLTSTGEQLAKLTGRVDESIQKVVEAAKEQPWVQPFVSDQTKAAALLPSSGQSLGVAKVFVTTFFGVMTDVLILIILSIYFCFSPKKYRGGVLRMVPVSWRDRFAALMSESSQTLWKWMLGRLLAMAIVGVLFGIGLAVIGIPLPIELGIFAAIVTFVPAIGAVAAVVPALLLATQQGPWAAVSVLAMYITIQSFESYLVTPLVQARQVDLPPAMIILAQILAGLVFGFWGIVFATPMVAIGILWIKRLYVEQCLEASGDAF